MIENKKCRKRRIAIIPTLIQHASADKLSRPSLNARKKSTDNKIHYANSKQIRRIKHNIRTGNITKHINLMLICHSCYNMVVIIVTFINTKSNLIQGQTGLRFGQLSICKQCRPRSDAANLLALHTAISRTHLQVI